MKDVISIRGARTHNLKNINIDIPLNKITTLYGPSGSGKSSLAFETIYQESKRRLINSFPTDVKFFWDIPQTVEVDSIFPVLPVWGLKQLNPVKGSRSNVSDLLGLTEKIQQLYFLLAENCCSTHLIPYEKTSLFGEISKALSNIKGDRIHLFVRKDDYKKLFPNFLPSRSFEEEIRDFHEEDDFWEILRFKKSNTKNLQKFINENSSLKELTLFKLVSESDDLDFLYISKRKCPKCDEVENIEIKDFSILSPYHGAGACSECSGHGMNLVYDRDKLVKDQSLSIEEGAVSIVNFRRFEYYFDDLVDAFKKNKLSTKKPFYELPDKKWKILYEGYGSYPGFETFFDYFNRKRYKRNIRIFSRKLKKEVLCEYCLGTRIDQDIHNLIIPLKKRKTSYFDFFLTSVNDALILLDDIQKNAEPRSWSRFNSYIDETKSILKTASDLGLGFLPLIKKVKSLTPSEYQRVLLSKFLSYRGSGSLFIFDEPTVGLSNDEENIVFENLIKLRDQGNTILIVEHSTNIISKSDCTFKLGPLSGENGGEIVSSNEKLKSNKIDIDIEKKKTGTKKIKVVDVLEDNVGVEYSYEIPLNSVTLVSGKTEINKNKIVIELLSNYLENPRFDKMSYKKINSPIDFTKVIKLSNSLGDVTSRSTIGSYLGLISYVRKHYANLAVSKSMGLVEGSFSYNSENGRCSTCEGKGVIEVEMNFLEDIKFSCDDCKGMKLKPIYANITDGTYTFHEAINSPMTEVFKNIKSTPKMLKMLNYLKLLKLDYLSLDRPIQTLSGGERQRLKLLNEIQSRLTDSILFLENITFGLSAIELESLIKLIYSLRDDNNTIVILDESPLLKDLAEHNIIFE